MIIIIINLMISIITVVITGDVAIIIIIRSISVCNLQKTPETEM